MFPIPLIPPSSTHTIHTSAAAHEGCAVGEAVPHVCARARRCSGSARRVRTRARCAKTTILLRALLAVGGRCRRARRDTRGRGHHVTLVRLRVTHVRHSLRLNAGRAVGAARRGGRRTLVWVVLALSELLEALVGGVRALHTNLHSLHTAHSLHTLHPLHPLHTLHTLHSLHAAHPTHTLHRLPRKALL